ncbi:MAG: hypothetical protein ACXADY_09485 [Candidatus Hodarchaeales archaeon]|jgi:hypothetical protein
MSRRDVKKELMKFVRREVKEKGADWGELRRVKRHIVVKKGLPNVPSLVLKSDSGLSYMAIIQWRKELRLYLFDVEGKTLHGQSYYQNYQDLQEVYKDIRGKSKKVSRYPPAEKLITQSQRNYELDRRFQKIWVRIAKFFQVSKSHRRNRPLIKGINQKDASGIFGTKHEEGFIHIPFQSQNLGVIFTYYSIYFILPSSIRQNEVLAEALALKLLTSFKQYKHVSLMKNRNSFEIIHKMEAWNSLKHKDVFNVLKKVLYYYDCSWETQDFISLVNLPLDLVKNLSRPNLSELFYQLFLISQNEDYLTLANFLGLPFSVEYNIPKIMSKKESFLFFGWLKSWQFSKVLPYLQQQSLTLTKGQIRAIEEAQNFQYANVLQVELTTKGIFDIKNKADLPIILTSAIQIFPDGTETSISFQRVTLQANSTILFDLNSLDIKVQSPIRIQYSLVKSPDKISHPVFSGTLVI